ncbi:MAG: 3-deoxy-7-phosphoheptulonate synthase [Bacteroidota bacterium]
MIIELKSDVNDAQANKLAKELLAIYMNRGDQKLIVTSSKMKGVESHYEGMIEAIHVFDSDIQLASRDFSKSTIPVKVGEVTVGGNSSNTLLIAGPCSVESEEQIEDTARFMKSIGITALRGGCFKPRTSPYSFQGLGEEGLKLMASMREKYNLSIVTEIRDATHADMVIDYTDVIQIGAKTMYDHGVLRKAGKSQKPVLLKRGFGTTLQEFVQAAEFILSGGNPNVMLCERGIRTFETKTRFTLDLCGVAYLKEYTNLPVILDPSHAMGHAYGVPDVTRACTAMGIDGLIIEVHPDPSVARSDAAQQLDFSTFGALYNSLKPIAEAVGRKIV